MIRNQWSHNPPRNFFWYHDWISNCLLHQLPNNKWRIYRQSIQRGRRPFYPIYHYQDVELATLPQHARPASVIPRNQTQVMFTGSGKSPPIQENQNHQAIEDYVNSLDQKHRWPFNNISGIENLEHVANAIRSSNCALVSDGSFSKSSQQAAAAWVIGVIAKLSGPNISIFR